MAVILFKCKTVPVVTAFLGLIVGLCAGGANAQDNYATWANSQNCTLNTSASGAAVAGSVTNFPVLIRLNAGNFNFAQAKVNGGDIRFAKSDGTHLPYAIERFDGGIPDSAEIWVKVDQIIGDNSTQFIKMYWGNSSVVDSSRSAMVFDTANGYKGVWHFNSSTDTVDQSANQLKARRSSAINSAKPVFNAGYIGSRSVELNAGNWVTFPSNTLVGADSQITVSFWARGDSLNMPRRNGTTFDRTSAIQSWPFPTGVNMTLPNSSGVVDWSAMGPTNSYCGSVPYTDSLDVKIRWNYWTLTKHLPSGRMRIYTNGALREENTQPNVMSTAIDSLVLGDCGWDYSFRGRIDEFRIAKIERDSNWVKLEYANQNQSQTLVRMSGALALLAPTISYTPTTIIDTQNVLAVTLTPTLGGGAGSSITITPALPTGLSFNTTTGAISGTPTALQAATQYIIKAVNASDSAKDTITISVVPQRPSIAYPPTLSATQGSAIAAVTPTLGLGQPYSFTIAPALPAGLALDATTGALTGIPTVAQVARAYIFTATNSSGSAKDTITITVTPANQISNPLAINGTYLSPTRIVVSISGYSTLPTSLILPNTFFAESIGVWSQIATYPVPGRVPAPKRNLLTAMKLRGAEPFIDTIDVVELSASDSIYALVASVYWKPPAGADTIAPVHPANGARVLMRDAIPPVNRLTIAGSYFDNALSDSGTLTIGNVGSIDTNRAAMIEIWRGTVPTPDFTNATATIMRPAAAEYRAGVTFSQIIHGLPVVQDTIYCAVRLTGKNGLYSTVRSGFFIAGRQLPANPIVVTSSALGSSRIVLNWNAVVADSFRVWYSATTSIPRSYQITGTAFMSHTISGSRTTDTLKSLAPNTQYYIGVQLFSGGQGSMVTVASSGTVTTNPISGIDTVANTISINRLWFDDSTNQVKVSFSVDTTLCDSLIVGIVSATRTWPVDQPQGGVMVTNRYQIAVVPLGSIPFGDSVYVRLWLRKEDNPWRQFTDSSQGSVRVPAFTWQAVTYFSNSAKLDDTVRVDNGRFIIRKDAGYQDDFTFIDTIRSVPLPALNGFVAVSGGYQFQEGGMAAQPLYVGVKYDADLAAQYGGASQVRLYRDSSDIMIRCDTVWTENGLVYTKVTRLQLPFVALIDTARPTAMVLSDTASTVMPYRPIIDSVTLSDNSGNLQWHVEYGKGGESLRWGSTRANSLRGTSQTIGFIISSQYVTDDNGVRIYLIFSDGPHTDTLDLSRRVKRGAAMSQTIVPGRWQPLFTSAVLDTTAMAIALRSLMPAGSTVWNYDNSRFRIFRWYSPGSDTSRWLEYSIDSAGLFSMTPGKLLWIKTRNQQTVISGSGTTTPLKGNFNQIVLRPRKWTDFGMPFKFAVKLADVFDATGSKSDTLQWYRWYPDPVSGKYAAASMYIKHSSLISDRTTAGDQLCGDSGFAYTVYNPLPVDVVLQIPSTPVVLSRGIDRVGKTAQTQLWCLAINGTIDNGDWLNPVYCGYVAGSGAMGAMGTPPGFSTSRMELMDRSGKAGLGQIVWHEYQNGGCEYNFRITTDEIDTVQVQYRIKGLESLPDGFAASLYNSVTGLWESGSDLHVATISKNQSAQGKIVVGDANYLARINNKITDLEIFFGSIYPNPVGRLLTIRYNLPYNLSNRSVSAVRFEIYDFCGRKVWVKDIRQGLRAGENILSWDTKQTAALLRGVYIVRMKIIDESGAVAKISTTKFTSLGQ